MLADPAGLLSGRTELRHRDEIVFESVPDPAVTTQRAIGQLLKSQGTCVENTNALDLTAASLRVIADAHDVDK